MNKIKEISKKTHRILGKHHLEASYSRVFVHLMRKDPEFANIKTETEINEYIEVEGEQVLISTRRMDLTYTYDYEDYVIEFKAIQTHKSEHVEQLQYYMEKSGKNKGYLISFCNIKGSFPKYNELYVEGQNTFIEVTRKDNNYVLVQTRF